MEENLFIQTRDIWVPSYAFWIMQFTSRIPAMDKQGPYRNHRIVLHYLFGWRSHLPKNSTWTLTKCQQYPRSNTGIRDEGSSFQVRIPSKGSGIHSVHYQSGRSKGWPGQNTTNMGFDNPKDQEWNTMFPRVLQLLSMVHRKIQQDSKTALPAY